MSEVTLTIGGRRYTVACADGEEAHITKLGESIDAKLKQMGGRAVPDSQNMLFAALLLADELHDAKSVAGAPPPADPIMAEQHDALIEERDALLRQLEELSALQSAGFQSSLQSDEDEMAIALERFAELLEKCADKLETKAASD